MIYLDNGATSLHKPVGVADAVRRAMFTCGNPGRGGHPAAMAAAKAVFSCRQRASQLFSCQPEQVVFTSNCTHGLNIAIRSVVKPGSKVVISGFEHNAVTRPLHALNAQIVVAGRKLFDWDNTLTEFEKALREGVSAAVFTHCSNVFGYILPVEQMAKMCHKYGVPLVLDAAQSAGVLPLNMETLGADYIAMPGHKGLLGPQGTGILLCNAQPVPLLHGGTGSNSRDWQMPDDLPDRLEAGTLNVPGIAGLDAGISYLLKQGTDRIFRREHAEVKRCAAALGDMGFTTFSGPHQSGTVSFVPHDDCEEFASLLGQKGVAVRAGLHCAPLAHESAGTLDTGTVRISFGHDASPRQTETMLNMLKSIGK